MKRTYVIAAILITAAIALCSFTYFDRQGAEVPSDSQQMQTLRYRGHTYICYRFYKSKSWSRGYSYGYGGASLVHDPDCPCSKSRKEDKR